MRQHAHPPIDWASEQIGGTMTLKNLRKLQTGAQAATPLRSSSGGEEIIEKSSTTEGDQKQETWQNANSN
jgi:hypothetical protein